jgi:hypothetical protein
MAKKRHHPPSIPPPAPPKTLPRQHGHWLAVAYVVVGIGAPLVYFLGHIRFHDGLPIILYVPYVAVWAMPIFVVGWWQRWRGQPDLIARQRALRDAQAKARAPRTLTQQRAYYRKLAATAAAFALAGIIVRAAITWIGNQGAGQPLPAYTPQQIQTADPATLPSYLRIVGAVAHQEIAWGYRYAVKYQDEEDFYVPLTMPDWQPAKPVQLIEVDRTFPDNPDRTRINAATPGSVEGELFPRRLPDWQGAEIARHGWTVATPAVLFQRQVLHGVVPGASPEARFLALYFAAVPTLLFGVLALGIKMRVDYKVRKYGTQNDYITNEAPC